MRVISNHTNMLINLEKLGLCQSRSPLSLGLVKILITIDKIWPINVNFLRRSIGNSFGIWLLGCAFIYCCINKCQIDGCRSSNLKDWNWTLSWIPKKSIVFARRKCAYLKRSNWWIHWIVVGPQRVSIHPQTRSHIPTNSVFILVNNYSTYTSQKYVTDSVNFFKHHQNIVSISRTPPKNCVNFQTKNRNFEGGHQQSNLTMFLCRKR